MKVVAKTWPVCRRRRPLAAALVLYGVVFCGITACFPISRTYVHLDPGVPAAKYSPEICRRYGPPVDVNYEKGGLAFELSVDDDYYKRTGGHFVIRAPVSIPIALPDLSVAILDKSGRSVGRAALDPRWTNVEADGRLSSADRSGDITTYRFAIHPLPDLPAQGEMRLPSLFVAGSRQPEQIVRFERRTWAGSLPLNC